MDGRPAGSASPAPSASARAVSRPDASTRKRARTENGSPRRSPSSCQPASSRATDREHDPIEIARARSFGFPLKEMIEIRPVPVRVGDRVVRARRDEELVAPVGRSRERAALLVRGRSVKPRLRPQASSGYVRRHVPHVANGQQAGEIESPGDLLEEEVRERRRGFADRKARVHTPLEKDDRTPRPACDEGHQRACEARADDRDVGGFAHGPEPQVGQEGRRGRFL